MKRVLAISSTPFYTPKGSSLRVKSIMENLTKEFEVDLVTYSEGEEPGIEGLTIHRTTKFFKPTLKISFASFGRFALDFLLLIKSLRLALFGNYDIIHAEDFEAAFAGRIIKIFKPRKKYVYDLHNSFVDNLEISKYSKSVLSIARKLEKFVIGGYDQFILNWQMYEDIDGIKEKPHFLYYDHTPTDLEEIKLPTSFPYMAYSGNFQPYQGIITFLQAYRDSNISTHVVLVGEPSKKALSFVKEHGLSDKVHFMGRLPITQSNYILANSLLCLIPRTYGKQPGLKMIHHLMLGKVTLAMNIPANTESLVDGKNAILYQHVGEIAAYLKKIEAGKFDVKRLENGALVSQESIRKIWSHNYFMQNYLKVLKDE